MQNPPSYRSESGWNSDGRTGRSSSSCHARPPHLNPNSVIPAAPASGLNATDVVTALTAAHAEGRQNDGLDVETGAPRDLSQDDITDPYSVKWWAATSSPLLSSLLLY